MTGLDFWKVQTIGNDFVLVDGRETGDADISALVTAACERRFGVGSDGFLIAQPAERGLELLMFNPDGTPDFCGNGLRCAALHAHREGWVGETFEILHGGRWIQASVDGHGRARITLPPAHLVPFGSRESAHGTVMGVTGTLVSTGSLHFVVPVDALPEDPEFLRLGPALETAPEFPEHVSVMFAQIIGERSLSLRIWERSVGETLGCGTGASAAAVVHSLSTGTAGDISVKSFGGELVVSLESWSSPVTSVSRPTRPFRGTLALKKPATTHGAVALF